VRFAKGHGTGNDFLIIRDPGGERALSPGLVTRLCDRHTGLGADGVLRAVPAGAGWFMDYRNADGSLAEMCGNGIRVFAAYLFARGLAVGPSVKIETRAGPREVWREPDGWLTVDMGRPEVAGESTAVVGGRACRGLVVSLGNPHLACLVTEPLAEFDLSAAPELDASVFPDGANVEIVRVTGDGRAQMRVHERGSGVTLSCGTGAVAAAAAAASRGGHRRLVPGRWLIAVPGGRLAVTLTGSASLLSGPAVIVAEGELDQAWLAEAER
jgi:diaminopimelate epimerase